MPKSVVPKPTDGELAILRVLWEQGPCTVRQVFEVLSRDRPLGYTTALKLLQIMTEKGLTTRKEQGQHHVYRARYAKEETQRRLVGDLLERAFGGSTSKLVMQVLATKRSSPDELREIRRLLAADKEKDHD
jgi:BlaI family transcriptional regulator, penicillinase repressor